MESDLFFPITQDILSILSSIRTQNSANNCGNGTCLDVTFRLNINTISSM